MNSGLTTSTVCTCGKLLQWQAADSVLLICPYCHKKHNRIANSVIQHEPAMLRCDSPVKLEMSLKLNGTTYVVCGRTQWLCESQNTQLWTLVNDHGACTYLHETWGEFYLLQESNQPISTSVFDQIFPEKQIKLATEKYYITRIDRLNQHRTEGETGIDYSLLKKTFQVYLRSYQNDTILMAWIHSKSSVFLYELVYCEPLDGKTDTKIRFLPIHL